jgi:hypothetical protein
VRGLWLRFWRAAAAGILRMTDGGLRSAERSLRDAWLVDDEARGLYDRAEDLVDCGPESLPELRSTVDALRGAPGVTTRDLAYLDSWVVAYEDVLAREEPGVPPTAAERVSALQRYSFDREAMVRDPEGDYLDRGDVLWALTDPTD